jgi:hypothetical protein
MVNPFLLFNGKRKGEGMNTTPNLQGVVPFSGIFDLLNPFTFQKPPGTGGTWEFVS